MPQSSSRPSARGGALDLFRFLAALFIVLYHAAWVAPNAAELTQGLLSRGYLATDFFLMLSGYVMGFAYGPKLETGGASTGAFLLKRLTRIWPSHAIVLALFAAVIFAGGLVGVQPNRAGWFDWSDLPAQLLLVQAWGFADGGGWNLPTWSLSALVVCYALFPAGWRALRRIGSPMAGMAAATLVILAASLATRAVMHQELYDISEHYGVLRALPLFLVGMAVSRVVLEAPMPPALCRWILPAALAALVALQFAGRADFDSMALIALALAAAGSAVVRRPSALIQWSARVSFPLFLTHALSFTLWAAGGRVLARHGLATGGWLFWTSGIAFALGAAVLFDRWIDQPVQALIARHSGRLRVPGGAMAALAGQGDTGR